MSSQADARHCKYYLFGTILPGQTPKKAYASGSIIKAVSLSDLARFLGIDPASLEQTVQRLNEFTRSGNNLDFCHCDRALDRAYNDPRVKPSLNLGDIIQPSFFSVRIWPGDNDPLSRKAHWLISAEAATAEASAAFAAAGTSA